MNLLKNRGAISFGGDVMPVTLSEINQPMAPCPMEHLAEPLPDGVSHVQFPNEESEPRTAQDFLAGALKRLVDLLTMIPESDKPRLQPLIDRVSQCWHDAQIEQTLYNEWKAAAETEHEQLMKNGKVQARVIQKCLEKAQAAEIALANAGEEVTASRNALTAYKVTNTLGRWHTKADLSKRDAEIEQLRVRYENAQKEKQRLIGEANAVFAELEEQKKRLVLLDVRERRLKAQLDGDSIFDPGLGLASHATAMPDEISLREGFQR